MVSGMGQHQSGAEIGCIMIVNIIGHGEGWQRGYDAAGEKWAINYFHPQADILFEIHPKGHPYHEKLARERENALAAGVEVIGNLQACLLVDLYGIDYFGSSTDFLIATAISEDVDEIHLWGVTMDDQGDHYEKRCATDFWCGYAMGAGIKVEIHGNSTVMTTQDGTCYGTFKPMARQYTLKTD